MVVASRLFAYLQLVPVISRYQLEPLCQVNDTPLMCFDGDSAGQNALLRAGANGYLKIPLINGHGPAEAMTVGCS